MTFHEILGDIFTALLLGLSGFAAVAVGVLIFKTWWETSDADIDLVGSQFVGADGKWDWSKGDSPEGRYGAPRRRVNIAEYARIEDNYDPQNWEGVEYDEDGRGFNYVEGEPQPNEKAVEVELELTEADGDNRS